MKKLIESLESSNDIKYMLDTCFVIYCFKKGHTKDLEKFCSDNSVGMSSFNLEELDHVTKKLGGTIEHHIRDFLKKKLISQVLIDVHPGDREGERMYVESFDPKALHLVPDASDAVLFVQAIKTRANILTRDKHHIFTALASNYSNEYGIEILNNFP